MGGPTFDVFTMWVTGSRRVAVGGLLGGALSGLGLRDAPAKKKKSKKKKHKQKKTDPAACESSLTCPDNTFCQKRRCVNGCEKNDDCSPDRYCALIEGIGFGFCDVGCRDNAQCERILGTRLSRCNFSNQCVLIECIFDSDCTPPTTCRDNFTCT